MDPVTPWQGTVKAGAYLLTLHKKVTSDRFSFVLLSYPYNDLRNLRGQPALPKT